MDKLNKEKRSENMAKIRARGNASTELKVLKLLRQHRITGWRRQFHIFGLPDFAFPKARVALFIDGCFWHGCPRCYHAPRSSQVYWKAKIARNRDRDQAVNRQLRARGWKVLRIWECELKNIRTFLRRVAKLTVCQSPEISITKLHNRRGPS